ncbi:unnamed protein product [Mytilus edulis]|uniref:DDE-1 domain-containing protein n=2 Tax=Mytilus edulis TaxID=6550 RepID=A0A8S3UEM1_MYTED|nr:unnamed protein product [Mytilus edulis]
MPRKAKNLYMKYGKENLENAIKSIKDGVYSYRRASQVFGVPKTTIIDHVSGRIELNAKPGRKPVIPIEMENVVARKVVEAANKGFGITKKQLQMKISRLCKLQKIETPLRGEYPGDDWWRGFKSRHPEIALRKPEKLSTSRSRMLNRVVVTKYFEDLGKVITDNNLTAATIWNMDETGKQFEHNPTNVCARKGSRNVPGRTSNSRENVTILASVNAEGNVMPPMCVVKGKTIRSVQSFCCLDAPVNTVWSFQERAWMCDMLGELWFKDVFLAHCGPERPQLLLLDSHRSHEVLGLLEEACKENTIVFALPPHCTHMLQPLDRTVFGPFSKAYDRECTEFLSKHPNNDINKQTWPRVFKTAWEAALTVDNIKNGFLACGIFPFDASVIPDSAFLPSDPFDVPLPVNENNSNSLPATETQAIVTVASDSNLDISVNESAVRNDEFLPVIISTPSKDEIEVLQPAFSPIAETRDIDDGFPSLDQVPLLLMALGNGEVQLEELENVESVTQVNTLTNSNPWNLDVESIFGLETASSEKKKKLRKSTSLTSHRILTSEEVMREKRIKEAEKENLSLKRRKEKKMLDK